MRPFDHAWQLLKNFPVKDRIDPKAHMMPSADNPGMTFSQIMPRPKTLENRQFNVRNIEEEDTRGRVRNTYQELDPANFSTGDDMARRLSASESGARESDSDYHDYRPEIDGMRVNESENFPALSHDKMDPRLKYPYPKDANNPGDFAGGY